MLALLDDLLSHAEETEMEAKLASPAMLVLDAVGRSREPGRVLGETRADVRANLTNEARC